MKTLSLSVFYLLIFCTTVVSTFGCAKQEERNTVNTLPPPFIPVFSDSGIRYLALGDSYTIGQGVAEKERFPYLTATLLQQQGITTRLPLYIAVTGWTTGNLLAAVNSQSFSNHFDVVTILIGVNDQYQGVDTATYRSRFIQILLKAIQLTNNRTSRVFVLSIPDYSVTPFVSESAKARVSREIDLFNAINNEVAQQYKVAYINITPLTKEAAADPTLLAKDGLHYSAKEHQQWAELLVPTIKKAVQ